MTDENKVFGLSKNARGEIVFEIHPQNLSIVSLIKGVLAVLLRILLPLFTFFDFLATKRKLVISSVGLGIGLGLSVLVTQRPDALQAFPSLVGTQNRNIRAQSVTIPSIDLSTPVTTGNVQDLLENVTLNSLVHDERSAELGNTEPVVIAEVGLQNILSELQAVQIGDEIQVQGSNNGLYRYKVTEIRDMKAEYLPNVIGVTQEALILYKSKNILRTQLYMVIAKQVAE